jgi:hypothetical protein
MMDLKTGGHLPAKPSTSDAGQKDRRDLHRILPQIFLNFEVISILSKSRRCNA